MLPSAVTSEKHEAMEKTSSLSHPITPQLSTPDEPSMTAKDSIITTIVDDGELSGAQIDGKLAQEKLLDKTSDPFFMKFLTKLASDFYVKFVEEANADAWSVQVWKTLSNTVFKSKLIDFFNSQTDFSKRLTSWRANSKFEDITKGKTLKDFVKTLKSDDYGVEYVYFWHALSGD
jgi:hypothetical protein